MQRLTVLRSVAPGARGLVMTRLRRTAAAMLLVVLLVPSGGPVAAQTAQTGCGDLPPALALVACMESVGDAYLDCTRQKDALVALARENMDPDAPAEFVAALEALAAGDCGAAGSPEADHSIQLPPGPVVLPPAPPPPPQPTAIVLPPPPPPPVAAFDITACLSTDAIETMLGKPTKFHAGDGPQLARFESRPGTTLNIEHIAADGATAYQSHLDLALDHAGWQVAGVPNLGDQAFVTDRGGTSRSLMIRSGDEAWFFHMDGVPAPRGFNQLGNIALQALRACP